MALNWQLDEETEKHMKDAMTEERDNPPPPEPESGPSTPSMAVEKDTPTPEVKEEEKTVERPRDPATGKFLPKEGGGVETKAEEKPAKPLEKPVEPPEGFVAHGAFHEERQRRKALQAQVEQMEKRWSDLVAKMQQTPQPQAPDPAQDFPGHVSHQLNQLGQQVGEVAKKTETFEQFQEQQKQEAAFISAYSQAAQSFAAAQPDFTQAYNHWLNNRLEELVDAGYSNEQALHIRSAEERGIVTKAFQDEVNPAQRLYAVAKRRGYTAASTTPAPEQKLDPAEKLKQIEQGQRATPAMGGSGMKPKLTLQSVAQMSDEEFAALDWEKTMRQLTP